jgi:hypothetical protein
MIGTLTLSISNSVYTSTSPIFLNKSCSVATPEPLTRKLHSHRRPRAPSKDAIRQGSIVNITVTSDYMHSLTRPAWSRGSIEPASHSLTVLSPDADASSLPSGEKATASTHSRWPFRRNQTELHEEDWDLSSRQNSSTDLI